MNSVKKVYWALALASLAACGPQSTPSAQSQDIEVATATDEQTQVSVVEELIKPSQPGAGWSRSLTLKGSQLDRVIIEARSNENDAWTHLGLSNESGTFIDTNVAQKRQYRFGGLYVSQLLPPISDSVVDSAPSNRVVKAFRIIVRSKISLSTSSLSFEAAQIVFEPNSSIVAFEPSSIGSQSAASIVVRAQHVLGVPTIDLRGQNGAAGSPGSAGRNGRDGKKDEKGENGANGSAGSTGSAGGNGGQVLFECSNPSSLDQSKIYVSGGVGGAGGQGGAGGKGGKGGSEWRSSLGRHGVDPEPPTYKPDGHAGSAGRTGATGSSGLPGAVVVNQLVVPTGFERYAKSYVTPLELTEQR
jgi:hypothetical protein